MPAIRTDDGPRRLRAVWLGPRGNRWYWTWTYVQWAVTLVALLAGVAIGFGLIWLATGDVKISAIIGSLWGGTAAVLGTKRLMRHVDYDRPLRYWRATLRSEWSKGQRIGRVQRRAGWWLSPAEPLTMSRYALAYLHLGSTALPPRMVRPRPPFAVVRLVRGSAAEDMRWCVTRENWPSWAVAVGAGKCDGAGVR